MLIFGEAHLRQILTSCASYYNESRTHLSLHKDAPLGRAVQRYGTIAATPVLSGCIIATRGCDLWEGHGLRKALRSRSDPSARGSETYDANITRAAEAGTFWQIRTNHVFHALEDIEVPVRIAIAH